MPPRGPRGGGFRGGRGGAYMGGIPSNSTMATAHQYRDWVKTTGDPLPAGGTVGGYYPGSTFSFIDLKHRISLAWHLSYHTKGNSRLKSFVGNFQALGKSAEKKARFEKVCSTLKYRHDECYIDDQTFGDRIMYEAMSYYGWLRRKTVITEEEYYDNVMKFAEQNGIDFEFEGVSRSR